MKSEQELIVSIITNTQRSSGGRNKSIVEIAEDIESLKNLKGSIGKEAEIANISPNMINKFISVFKLCEEVKQLVKKRSLDSVETVYSLSKYPNKTQIELANFIIDNKISSQDIRALSPYIKQNPNKEVNTLLKELLLSKNVKVAVIKFPIEDSFSPSSFEAKIKELVSLENVIETSYENGMGVLKVNKSGEKQLRSAAANKGISLVQFIKTLILK